MPTTAQFSFSVYAGQDLAEFGATHSGQIFQPQSITKLIVNRASQRPITQAILDSVKLTANTGQSQYLRCPNVLVMPLWEPLNRNGPDGIHGFFLRASFFPSVILGGFQGGATAKSKATHSWVSVIVPGCQCLGLPISRKGVLER